jgi:protein-S-isoprenylcysteine O-methyltransferase Ste14
MNKKIISGLYFIFLIIFSILYFINFNTLNVIKHIGFLFAIIITGYFLFISISKKYIDFTDKLKIKSINVPVKTLYFKLDKNKKMVKIVKNILLFIILILVVLQFSNLPFLERFISKEAILVLLLIILIVIMISNIRNVKKK